MTVEATIREMAKAARTAAKQVACFSADQKNAALKRIAKQIKQDAAYLKDENKKDLLRAKKMGLSGPMIDRLALTDETLKSMTAALIEVTRLEDPVGSVLRTWTRPNGLQVSRMRIPLGVIGIIYESRPNVTVDAAGLCLKAGNAVILRGGSEAFNSNQALADIIRRALQQSGLPEHAVQIIAIRDRSAVTALLKQAEFIDLIIPRGGEGLIRFVVENSKIPVLKHFKGVCHVYVDASADLDMAKKICFNAKVQRPGVCNAMETLLVAQGVAAKVLPPLCKIYLSKGVELRGDDASRALVKEMKSATEEDWRTEYLAPILAVRIVAGLDEAIAHINTHSSQHTDSIVTENYSKAMRFLREVDSSSVMVNASTRFADGFEYGLGAEIGISTDKIHARGPVGLEGLTSQKFIVLGSGQIRI